MVKMFRRLQRPIKVTWPGGSLAKLSIDGLHCASVHIFCFTAATLCVCLGTGGICWNNKKNRKGYSRKCNGAVLPSSLICRMVSQLFVRSTFSLVSSISAKRFVKLVIVVEESNNVRPNDPGEAIRLVGFEEACDPAAPHWSVLEARRWGLDLLEARCTF